MSARRYACRLPPLGWIISAAVLETVLRRYKEIGDGEMNFFWDEKLAQPVD